MNPAVWRSHCVPYFRLGSISLDDDGRVSIGDLRFRKSAAINATIEGAISVHRPEGDGQFLLIRRPHNLPLVFRYREGMWERWVRLYSVDIGHFRFRELVRSWSVAAPFYFLSWLVILGTLVRAIYLLCQPDISWGRAVLGLLFVVMVVGWLKSRG